MKTTEADTKVFECSYVLRPTMDESKIYKIKNGRFHISTHAEVNGKYGETHHLYICSKQKIKGLDWCYVPNHGFILQCTKASNVFGTNEVILAERFEFVDRECLKIEFTTDPNLIAKGVPALPVKTWIWIATSPFSSGQKEVSFLNELLRKHNIHKDNDEAENKWTDADMEKCFNDSREKISHPDFDYIHETFADYKKTISNDIPNVEAILTRLWVELEKGKSPVIYFDKP